MLTTLRQDATGWYVDVTDNEDGKVDITVGPTEDKQQAQRWERHILREHAMWMHMIAVQSITLFDTCMRKLRYTTSTFSSTTQASHDAWMRHHPLAGQPLVLDDGTRVWSPRPPLKLGLGTITVDMDKRHE